MQKLVRTFLLLTVAFLTITIATVPKNISQSTFEKYKSKYDAQAVQRLLLWDNMIEEAKTKNILHQLKDVNDFFNKIRYSLDSKHWGQNDYWATPFEFMGTGAGDCEDYAIAKYFTLRKLGVPDEKLRITYVKLSQARTQYEQAHMVLTYYHKPNSIPIVLDNVDKRLQVASKRPDLKPVYSFNAEGLWKAQTKGKGDERVGSNNLKSWKDLMSRI
ncbi:transglutaminase-like cysteine peptidase [Candidatus Marinarcus aquaticus]|uniref:Transglutaminase n=1 Tax=Candidatus Marinarcus aquaticus TaxID=2044504 RepID=A0A4Q0XUE4_9BACT|nr:transglutaminase-like cysteine peptidase [Candidatus Marinarcus aquaticus]RXJ60545.1 transglutaminase [Candidatus Marinarcus aquaticus]